MADPAHQQSLAVTAPVSTAHLHAHEHGHVPYLAHHFEDMNQQSQSASLGMWAFLGTEVMFFGGLIGSYIVYRFTSPDAWAISSSHLNWKLATVNTAVLLMSSLAMALAVRAGQLGVKKDQVKFLILTMFLGTLFLVFKGYEYYEEYDAGLIPGRSFNYEALLSHGGGHEAASEGGGSAAELAAEHATSARTASNLIISTDELIKRRTQMFFVFYFFMTGLHAIHMVVGLSMLTVMLIWARQGRFTPSYFVPLEVSGLYWHFIDIVWVFLFPLLYLVALHK